MGEQRCAFCNETWFVDKDAGLFCTYECRDSYDMAKGLRERLATALARAAAAEGQVRALTDLLRRLRQWDALNPGPNVNPAYPWADALYWIREIDAALNAATPPPVETTRERALREALRIVRESGQDTMDEADTEIPRGAEGRDKAFCMCETLWAQVKFATRVAGEALDAATPAAGET
ncbi:MAG TPA: hypothetical protein VD930_13555 [Gemmatimonadales bacterium]|nr:hypothetical protein [Gemmatimonadales bacterium]